MLSAISAYQGWVFLHLVGVFGFLLAHGVSAGVALKLRRERDPARVDALLQLSGGSIGVLHGSVLVLLVGGVVAGFEGRLWGAKWIWAALVLLIVMYALMFLIATPYYRRIRTIVRASTEGSEVATPERLAEVLDSPRPVLLALVGGVGLLAILYLMVFKPF